MSQPATPSVSILVPCFNAEPWVARAVDSALEQTAEIREILVLDDGSTDGSLAVLERYGDRISLVRGGHFGCATARNGLMQRSDGDWIQFLDADDVLDPDKVERQIAVVSGTDADVVVSPIRSDDGKVMHAPEDGDPWCGLMRVSLGITSANLWRREAVIAAGGWNEEIPCCLEYDLLLRLLQRGARIVTDTEPRATWGTANPDSLSRRDEARRDQEMARIIQHAAVYLREVGAFEGERRTLAVSRLLELARLQWKRKHDSWREVIDGLHELEPEPWSLVPRGRGLYAAMYRALGFAWAQRYDDAASRVRGNRD